MKHPKTFPTRAAANEVAKELRKTFIGVLVYPVKGRFGIAYDDKQRRSNLKKRK